MSLRAIDPRWLLAGCAALILLGFCSAEGAVQTRPGVLAPDPPRQVAHEAATWEHEGHEFRPRARFELQARVLGREDYRFDRGAKIAPVDLALGWGRMSDTAVLSALSITQSGRWWYWRSDALPIPHEEIQRSASNMHLIPATDAVATALDRVREGHVVRLRGILVDVRGSDGFQWNTSLSREDSGEGACELVWVEAISVVGS